MTDDCSFSLFVLLPGWHVEPPRPAPYVVRRASSAPDDEEVADQDQVPSLTLALLCACPGLVVGLFPSPFLVRMILFVRQPHLFLSLYTPLLRPYSFLGASFSFLGEFDSFSFLGEDDSFCEAATSFSFLVYPSASPFLFSPLSMVFSSKSNIAP